MKNKIINIFLVLILLCGIGVLSYPFISNILQDRKQDQILTEYNEEMEKLSDAEIEDAKEKAKQYKEQAIEELTALGVTFPVGVDYHISASSQTA